MKKLLSENQQRIINELVEEFTKENQTLKKVSPKSALKELDDALKTSEKQVEAIKKFEILEGKKLEATLEAIIKNAEPILKKYEIKVNRCYSGCGVVRRSIYLSFSYIGYDSKTTANLCIEGSSKFDNIGTFQQHRIEGIKVGYPSYKDKLVVDGHEAILKEIVDWVVHFKNLESKFAMNKR